MAKKITTRRKRGPLKRGYKPERPVVSLRFDPEIYAHLRAEADASGVTFTDVVYRRLLQSQTQQMHAEYKASLIDEVELDQELHAHPELHGDREAAWRQVQRRSLEADLRANGYTRITSPGGALWAEPGASIPASIVKTIQKPMS
ncbi:hypothetical protein JEY40_31750 [Bradyrhizobium japonicum]|uniref:hypothetical protein n=1 Tax=Bradyrhizobium japonicum TaxID=375 RepID=UPI00200BD4F8|nr:hypothetical protein [Bradyrhizobium japonicum]UQD70499.1 hypothetical protein JEY40_31750 [Bradyrhizobium japonicum]